MPLLGSRGAGSARGFGFFGGKKKVDVEFLVIAGGGAGGTSFNSYGAGGGGAGGYRTASDYELFAGESYTVTVGAGGSAASNPNPGSNSVLDTITSTGGGRGDSDSFNRAAGNGGSGGGGQQVINGGLGNTPSTSPSQKYPDTFSITNPGGGLTFSTSTAGGFKTTTFTAGTGNIIIG
jgi:hypothetical protein